MSAVPWIAAGLFLVTTLAFVGLWLGARSQIKTGSRLSDELEAQRNADRAAYDQTLGQLRDAVKVQEQRREQDIASYRKLVAAYKKEIDALYADLARDPVAVRARLTRMLQEGPVPGLSADSDHGTEAVPDAGPAAVGQGAAGRVPE